MSASKYLSTLFAATSLSLVAPAFAEGEGVQSYCDLVDSAVAANQTILPPNEYPVDADPGSAFCGGLQARDAVKFNGNWTEYYVSEDKEIMAGSLVYPGGDNTPCETSIGASSCVHIPFSSYYVSGPAHPDYSDAAFSAAPLHLEAIENTILYPGDRAGVTTESNTKIYFDPDPTYDPADPEAVPNTTYRLKTITTSSFTNLYMVPGDYYIENLNLGSNNKIILLSEGTVRLFVKNTSLSAFTNLGDPNPLKQLVVISDGNFALNSNSKIWGYVYAAGNLTLGDFTYVVGAFNAQNIHIGTNGNIFENVAELSNVDWGNIVANVAPGVELPPLDASDPLTAPDITRHSGKYDLHYPNFLAEDYDQSVFTTSDIAQIYAEYLDPTNYVDSDTVAHAADNLDPDSLLIGWIYGGITVIVGGFPVNLYIAKPIAALEPLVADVNDQALQDDMATKIDEYNAEFDNPDRWITTDPDINGNVYYLHELLTEDDGDGDPNNDPMLVFETEQARADAVQEKKDLFETNITDYYAGIRDEWNVSFNSLASWVEYGTYYPDGGQYGVTGYHFDNGGGWIGIMSDNARASVPVVFPIALWPLIGISQYGPYGAWCGAWLAAFEAGCFAPDDGDVNPGSCQYPVDGQLQDVDMALFAAAGANLTCGVFGPNFLFAATVGMAISAQPYGTVAVPPAQ